MLSYSVKGVELMWRWEVAEVEESNLVRLQLQLAEARITHYVAALWRQSSRLALSR